jgi:hypothetical protein
MTPIENILLFTLSEPESALDRREMVEALSKDDRKVLDIICSLIKNDIKTVNVCEEWRENPRRT